MGYAVTASRSNISRGLPGFHLVGLPNTAVKRGPRARSWRRSATAASGFPAGKVTVNLAPADVRKEGAAHDLAIALAVLAAQRRRESQRPVPLCRADRRRAVALRRRAARAWPPGITLDARRARRARGGGAGVPGLGGGRCRGCGVVGARDPRGGRVVVDGSARRRRAPARA